MNNDFFQRDMNVVRLANSNTNTVPDNAVPLDDMLLENAGNPKRVQGDAGSVEQHSLQDLIAVEKFLQSKKAVKNGIKIQLIKISPDGTV